MAPAPRTPALELPINNIAEAGPPASFRFENTLFIIEIGRCGRWHCIQP